MFYEKFANQAAIDHHLNTPHFKQFQNYLKVNEPIAAQSVTRWRSFV